VVPIATTTREETLRFLGSQFAAATLLALALVLTVGRAQADDVSWRAAIQPDGKIVVGGWTTLGSKILKTYFALARYTPGGSLDAKFGRQGKVATSIGSPVGAGISDDIFGLAVASDGKIVAAGDAYNGSNWDFALTRYKANGSLDPGFGSGGKVMTNFEVSDRALGVVVQPDGKVVAGGLGGADFIHGGGDEFLALARYLPNGSLDSSFGTGGRVTYPGFGTSEYSFGLLLQPDGKIVASNGDLVRYKPDGSLDSSFGIDGRVTTPGFDAAGIALQSDGKIIAAGSGPNCGFMLARYDSNGMLDPSFGTGGLVTTAIGSGCDAAVSVALQADGKIVAVGRTENAAKNFDLALARYKPDGSLDTGFGAGGKVVSTHFSDAYAIGASVALQPDGKIVVTGGSFSRDFRLARYLPDGSPDPSFGTSGLTSTSFTVCAVPRLKGKGLNEAKTALRNARCALGKITRAFSSTITRGRVMGQKPGAGTWHKPGTKVSLVISKGRRNAHPPSGRPGAIIYDSTNHVCNGQPCGRRHIFAINPNGTGRRELTVRYDATEPDWAPNGSKIAFNAGEALFLMNANGSHIHRLVRHALESTFAPDGKRIAFRGWGRGGHIALWSIRLDGTGRQEIVGGNYLGPDWSPNGKWIAFERGLDLYVIGANGGRPRRLTHVAARGAFAPAWSPNGKEIAFLLGPKRQEGWSLAVVNASGGAIHIVRTGVDESAKPAWSPDGRRLACVMYVGQTGTKLVTVKLNGSGLHMVTTRITDAEAISWRR
jgi:uncharacterized delta-60 repeat protein